MSDPSIQLEERMSALPETAKKGFDLSARLKNRGLRRGSITLYLDEEMGPELGWANDIRDGFENVIGREREGVIGDLDQAEADRNVIQAQYNLDLAIYQEAKSVADVMEAKGEAYAKMPVEPALPDYSEIDAKIAELEKKRDALIEELTKTGIRIEIKAVPPIIQKDQHRKAKEKMGIKQKKIPEDLLDEFTDVHTALLMTEMFQSVTDMETGDVNPTTSYEDAINLIGYLPPGQYQRLNNLMGQLQLTDAISVSIESQEDFS